MFIQPPQGISNALRRVRVEDHATLFPFHMGCHIWKVGYSDWQFCQHILKEFIRIKPIKVLTNIAQHHDTTIGAGCTANNLVHSYWWQAKDALLYTKRFR